MRGASKHGGQNQHRHKEYVPGEERKKRVSFFIRNSSCKLLLYEGVVNKQPGREQTDKQTSKQMYQQKKDSSGIEGKKNTHHVGMQARRPEDEKPQIIPSVVCSNVLGTTSCNSHQFGL